MEQLQKEHARLSRNKERRLAREKQKNKKGAQPLMDAAASPSSTPAPSVEKAAGTTRKCANCGQAGHIKTNKKYYCSPCVPQKAPKRGRHAGSKKSTPRSKKSKAGSVDVSGDEFFTHQIEYPT